MASFDFVVDTTPMANSVSNVSGHVRNTTAAVIAMESAVIRSEQIASANVCKNVTNGFHVLIQSQISQKAAGYFSIMSSKMILLMEFAKTLGQTRSRMNNDYQRLKREYTKIFQGLDKALDNRIRQLDKRAAEIGDARKYLVTGRIVKDAPSALFYSKDTQNTAQMMYCARIKSKAVKALDNMANNVFSTQCYKRQLESLLQTSNISNNSPLFVPVLLTEEKNIVSAENTVNNVFISEGIGDAFKKTIANTVMQNFDACKTQTKSTAENTEIKNEFMKLISSAALEERISKQIVSLFNGGI